MCAYDLSLLTELRALATPKLTAKLKKGLAKAADPEAEYRAAMAKLDQRIKNIKFQQEMGHVENDEYMERVGKVNVEKVALRSKLDAERKAFNINEWDEKFAAIVASTVGKRVKLDASALMVTARQQASGKGIHALGYAVAGDHKHTDGRHYVEDADAIEFSLWAERLPELLERIEVDVVKRRISVVLVPRAEWLPYLRKKLPGNESISFLRANASSRVPNVWKWPRPCST